ncbi:MAG: Rpn family recombination-promoting nuclease/putative transposase [Myxococcales bacterium]|nr:Rpn family recombination-promoting nuclease/putative transposase [Myxococcales bacterium]MCB9523699.1 Rpn family recombination-promoting nuclease/putative transposase [Myxococcales bacterium]
MTPHDHLFQSLFAQPANAASLVASLLPPALVAALDLDRLSLRASSLPGLADGPRTADLVFEVPWRARTAPAANVILLCEHQSQADRWMPMRLIEYALGIWHRARRDDPKARRLPLVVPLVVHNGRHPWRGPRSLGELQAAPCKVLEAIAPHYFDGRFVLDDLPASLDDALRARSLTVAAELGLRMLRDARTDLSAGIRGAKRLFLAVEASASGLGALAAVVRYCLQVGGEDVLAALVQEIEPALSPSGKEAFMTGAEILRAEGRAEGRAAGLTEGAARVLLTQLRLRFGEIGPAVQQRIAQASVAELEAMSARILTADSLQAVLTD